ncbi:hypothetical protein [Gallibacterium anatis]|uniref:hypothetical protein n=1 Tax=Gallibacterium anatis TaxID=750 RepID=UPI000A47CC09|nr:hypothetical protein [Gallibacterium anatis]
MLALFIAIAIWGSSLPIGKLAYNSFEPVILVQFRFCIAALIVLPTFIRFYRYIVSAWHCSLFSTTRSCFYCSLSA